MKSQTGPLVSEVVSKITSQRESLQDFQTPFPKAISFSRLYSYDRVFHRMKLNVYCAFSHRMKILFSMYKVYTGK